MDGRCACIGTGWGWGRPDRLAVAWVGSADGHHSEAARKASEKFDTDESDVADILEDSDDAKKKKKEPAPAAKAAAPRQGGAGDGVGALAGRVCGHAGASFVAEGQFLWVPGSVVQVCRGWIW